MLFLNTWEIDDMVTRYRDLPVLGRGAQVLAALRDLVDANSDGWAYWAKPVTAAAKLQTMLKEGNRTFDATLPALKLTLRPIKSFCTRNAKYFPPDDLAAFVELLK